MPSAKNDAITPGQVLFPVSLLAFVVFILMAFQTSQILREHEALETAKTQQDKSLEEAQKVQTQLDALAVGTLKLSQQGDKNAVAIIDRMKQLGITVNAPQGSSAAVQMPKPAGSPNPAAPSPAMTTEPH